MLLRKQYRSFCPVTDSRCPEANRDNQSPGAPPRQFAHALLVMFFAACFATAESSIDSLTKVIQDYIGTPDAETKTTEFAVAFVDLRDDGRKEAIVYLSSDGWCGTAGCTMLILAPEGTSYNVVSKIPAVRLPIRVLTAKANGWHSIGVIVRKSGTAPLYEAILSFDGKSYPYVSDGAESHGKVEGKLVMPAAVKLRPLYP